MHICTQHSTISQYLIKYFYVQLFQGLPSCPNFVELRSRLPELSCWGLPHLNEKGDLEEVSGNNNNTSHLNNNGNHPSTPLHKFYKQQRKMPGFRGRRGLCGCFQVSYRLFKL